jgi:SynChlorMet cassette radical SAM/SPASM protein ScmE
MKIMNTPRSVDLDVTNKCNLRCKYCAYFSGAAEVKDDLPTEEWLTFFEELNRCAVMKVCLSGGEPFVREDIRELIEGVVKNRMRFNILSNGTLITDEIASFLASTGRCSSVQVSIDGSSPETHDVFCGEGVFKKALEGLRCLQRHKIHITVRVTIHRHNVRELDEIARLLLEDLGIPDFSTNSASYMGLCRENDEEVQLSIEERVLAMESLLRLNRKYNGRISAAAGPLAESKQWLKMERARREGAENIPGCGFLRSCNGVFSKLAVRADGVIVPCNAMSHIELGRINHDDLREVWQNHPEIIRLRDRQNIPLTEIEFCKGCEYVMYCRGNCPALAYTIVGDDSHPNPNSCLRQFLEAGGTLPDEKLLTRPTT